MDDLHDLIEAIRQQTEALSHLAASNLALVDLLAGQAADTERPEPSQYLDGTAQ